MDLLALQNMLSAVSGARVVVVGDVMVDRFVHGEVRRVSAEAPIPILARQSENVMLGAAGNVARNLAALGAEASLIGVIGVDGPGDEAQRLIDDDAGIIGLLAHDRSRATTVKTRFVSAGQQLLRVDLDDTGAVAGEIERHLVAAVQRAGVGAGAILLSDYAKGVATPAVIAACLAAANTNGIPLIVDSKARGFAHYGKAALVKPNAAELAHATDMPTSTDAEIEAALASALALSSCHAILATRSAKGMSLAIRGEPVRHFRRTPREVFDTSGAGDTVLAALGVALARGGAIDDAVEFALLASSVAVEKSGTATVSPSEMVEAELAAHRAPSDAKIATIQRMVSEIARWRALGLRIGFTNGCFDILHPGHISYLAQARGWCDRLVVGLNSDRSVSASKGPARPVNSLEARALVLAGLASVDLVVPFDTDTPAALIAAARPEVLIKGGDYTIESVVGADLVRAYGGEVRLAAYVAGHSTTATLRRVQEGA